MFTEAQLSRVFRQIDLERGRSYLESGRILEYLEVFDDSRSDIRCRMRGTRVYDVHIQLHDSAYGTHVT